MAKKVHSRSFEERFSEADNPSKFWAAIHVLLFFAALYWLIKTFVP